MAFVPSSLMLGVTTYLTSDVAPMPLLWTVPLALYLLSFILVFTRLPRSLITAMIWLMPVALLYAASTLHSMDLDLRLTGPAHLAAFFVVAMVCHQQLAALRPDQHHLTEYFIWVSVGGLLGGVFNGLMAPLCFPALWEYPLVLVLAATQLPALLIGRSLMGCPIDWCLRTALVCSVAVLLWRGAARTEAADQVVVRERSFYGALRVIRGPQGKTYSLAHGNVRHGTQLRSSDPRQRRLPMSYYFPSGPIGQLFQAFHGKLPHVGVVGLGIGTLASYGEAGQQFTFYEIDPLVEQLARDTRFFTFLDDGAKRGVDIHVVLGDARLRLAEVPDGAYDLLVLDAFSGDSIPAHLLTQEALEMYLAKLATHGLIAFHISNEYIDLPLVLTALANQLELCGRLQDDRDISVEDARRGNSPSTWLVLARSEVDLRPVADDERWVPLDRQVTQPLWTDAYSNLFGVLKR